jgi:hypothetical protein
MKDNYDFSNGIRGKYKDKIVNKPSWILEPEQCKFCGKLLYETLDDAEYAAKQKSTQNQKLYTYSCPYKIGWHLTSMLD